MDDAVLNGDSQDMIFSDSLTKLCFEGLLLLLLMCRLHMAVPLGSHSPLFPWLPQPPLASFPYMTPFRNGNGHISTPVRWKSLLTIAFESSLRDLQLVSHWHCRKTSCFTKKWYTYIYIYFLFLLVCIYIYIYLYIHIIYMHLHTYRYIYTQYVYIFMYIYVYICIYPYIYIIFIHIYKYIYIYIYCLMKICTYIYVHIFIKQ